MSIAKKCDRCGKFYEYYAGKKALKITADFLKKYAD